MEAAYRVFNYSIDMQEEKVYLLYCMSFRVLILLLWHVIVSIAAEISEQRASVP